MLVRSSGSGKTRVIIERIAHLVETGIDPSKILALTFTNKAAKVMQERLAERKIKGVTASTMHSLAVRLIIKDGEIFSIYDEDDCRSIIKATAKRHKITDKEDLYEISDQIALFKDNQITASQCSSKYREIYLEYENELFNNNALDFADLITKLIRKSSGGTLPWDHVLVDEVQDLSNAQIIVVQNIHKGLIQRRGSTTTLVGDIDQCQPIDTKVLTSTGVYKTLEELDPIKDRLQSFDRVHNHTYKSMKFTKSKRHFCGLLYHLKINNKIVKCTPNHKWPVRLVRNKYNKNTYCTYIMQKGNRFRIGQCLFFGQRSAGFGFGVRCRLEKADKAWIINIHNTRQEALIQEEILSLKYGIPQTCFQEHSPGYNKNIIDAIFNGLDLEDLELGVINCLSSHNRSKEYPFWSKQTWTKYGYRTSHECHTYNLLEKVMLIPQIKEDRKIEWVSIDKISLKDVSIPVISLDVEKYHTYILEHGIVTCNSVYEWRNAKPQIIKSFVDEQAEIIPLGINFRSTRSIVHYSKKLIEFNKNRIDKPLVAHSKEFGSKPEIRVFYDSNEEAEYVADMCSKHKNICILYRSNWMSSQLEMALTKAKIGYTVSDTVQFLDRKEVKDVLSYIRVAINSNDLVSLKRSIQSPKRGIGAKTLAKITKFDDIIDNEKLQGYVSLIYNLRERRKDAGAAVRGLLLKSNYLSLEEKDRIGNLDQLVSILSGKTLEEAMFELTGGSPTEDSDSRIHLMTLHSCKGTEYDKVIIIGCEEGITPHINSQNLEEERRLFYVGMTRAEQDLTMTFTRRRLMFGTYNAMQPTRFFREIGLSV